MAKSFTHLHVHTEYSMLDGASRVGDVVAAAAADGQPAIGITDHGNMYGVLPMYQAAREAGIVPIIGTELYQAYEHRSERPVRRNSQVDDSGGEVEGGRKAYYHLTALAENTTGYRNLIQLSSRAYLEGYYQKPKVDWEILADHHEGVIATTGCLGGHVLQRLLNGDEPGALEAAARLQDIFGRDNLFIELQDQGLPEQARTNPQLIEIARRLQAPLLATNDSHYTHQADAEAHDALLCVQTNAKIHETNRFKFSGSGHYLKSRGRRCAAIFSETPEACDNTLWVAERANVEIEFGQPILPSFPVPEGHTEVSYLRELTYEGAAVRYGETLAPHVRERIEYELGVIESMGFPAYFLVVWDLVEYRALGGHPRRSRPGERGGLVRRVLPAHRRHRPDPLRPAVRAVPQPGPQADARHRHGLRLARPRPDDQVRRAEVRLGPRRADRHVLHDQGPGRGA